LSIFVIGLLKKDAMADHFAIYAQFAFSHPGALSMAQAWSGALSYSLQLYFDFSGYSEMAIGLALLFNIHFPANFDSPYKSASIIEFWQRFHMTLTRYLNLYLYNPLALWVVRRRTARKLPVGRPGLKTVSGFLAMVAFPTLTTMALIGVWHGAGFQFLFFGLLHGVYLTVNHLWRVLFHKKNAPELTGPALWFSTAWKVGLTYAAVVIGQIFFRAESFHAALAMLGNMAGHHSPGPLLDPEDSIAATKASVLIPEVLAFIVVWFAPNVLQIFDRWKPSLTKPHSPGPKWFQSLQWEPSPAWGIALGLLAGFAVLALGGQTEFLYFRF
jgi:alginate O-acetyltransferase complex protein AlgI